MSQILTTKCDREGCHGTTGENDSKWFTLSGLDRNCGFNIRPGIHTKITPQAQIFHVCSFECALIKLKGLLFGNGGKSQSDSTALAGEESSLSETTLPPIHMTPIPDLILVDAQREVKGLEEWYEKVPHLPENNPLKVDARVRIHRLRAHIMKLTQTI